MNGSLSFEVVRGGIVAPLTFLENGQNGNPGIFDGGAYYADGFVCPRSLQRKAGFLNQPRPLVSLTDAPRIPGRHLYAGMLKNEHFGHFVAESLARLWPLSSNEMQGLDSIVFYTRLHRQPVPQWASDFIALIAPGVPLHIVSEPTVFNNLVIPDQAAHPSNGFVYGHPAVRQAFARLREIEGARHKKVYVSRSRLSNSGGFLGEKRLEEILEDEGFSVIHPQDHSLSAQVAVYNGAEALIFAEGAAIHLFALTCRSDQTVYIIQRRKNASIFDWQLRSFGLAPKIGPEPPSAYFIPEGQGQSTLFARARINFEKLRDQLIADGLVRGENWNMPEEELVREEIQCIEKSLGRRLVEHSIH